MYSNATVLDIEAGVAAAKAIAERTRDIRAEEPDYKEVVPKVIDPKLHLHVARATLNDVFDRGLNQGTGADRQACLARLEERFQRD